MKDKCNKIDQQIGANIRRIRVLKGMSQEKLGQACGDITFQQIQKYEKGTNRVGGSRVVLISRALGCEIKDLFEGVAADGTGDDTPDVVSVSELTLVRNFRKIKVSGGQHAIMAAVRAMAGAADQPAHEEANAA